MDTAQIVRDDEVSFGDTKVAPSRHKKIEYDTMGRFAKILVGSSYASLAVGSAAIGGIYGLNHETISIKEGLENCFQYIPALVQGILGAAALGTCFGRAAFEEGSSSYRLNRSLTSKVIGKTTRMAIGIPVGIAAGFGIGLGVGGVESSAGYLIGRVFGAM